MTIHYKDNSPVISEPMLHYKEAPKDGSTYSFVMVENGLQADKFMQAKKIDEAWLYRAGGKLYLAWRTG